MSPRFPPGGQKGSAPTILLTDCLAKRSDDGPGAMTVGDHIRLVGLIAEELLARVPPAVKRIFPPGIAALVAAHDVGKVSPGFQWKIRYPDRLADCRHNLPLMVKGLNSITPRLVKALFVPITR